MPRPVLQAMVLADHVYQDRLSGKFIISGTFGRIGIRAPQGHVQPPPPSGAMTPPPPSVPPAPPPRAAPQQPVQMPPSAPAPAPSAPAPSAPAPEPYSSPVSTPSPTPASAPMESLPGSREPAPPMATPAPQTSIAPAQPSVPPPAPAPVVNPPAPPAPPAPVSGGSAPPQPANTGLNLTSTAPTTPRAVPPKNDNYVSHSLDSAAALISVSGSPYLYLALTGIHGKASLSIQFVNQSDDTTLFEAFLDVMSADPVSVTEYCVPMPQLPIAKPGVYSLDLLYSGEILGSWRLVASSA